MPARPLIVPSEGGNFLLKSPEQANTFNKVLAESGFNEQTIRTAFPTENGEQILNALIATQRRSSQDSKRGQEITSGQWYLLDLFRTMALAQRKVNIVRQIDSWKENNIVTADSAAISLLLTNLKKFSGVVLPEQEVQEAIDEAVMERVNTGEDDLFS